MRTFCRRTAWVWFLAAAAGFLAACESPASAPPAAFAGEAAVVVLTDPDDLADHVGRWVTIRGEVSQTKLPTILGVDVALDAPALRGRRAQASGYLLSWLVTPSQIQAANDRAGGEIAHRGPGRFYELLHAQGSRTLAVARPAGPDGR